ncbi:primase C-terminal domain-containing protein [Cytobacillus horneckiae]|uniref:primase C-terminal domain-containing protein n=1 Tax=Cytobacillus horneckiae TaxID=549687 RepID=UPI0034CDB690
MLFQEPLFNHPAMSEVQNLRRPESLSNPSSFFVELGRNKPGKDGTNIFIRNDYREVNWFSYEQTLQDYVKQHNGTGWGLYSTAFQYNNQDPYVADLRGDFFLDFDDEDDIRNAQEDALRIIQHLTISPNYKIPSNMIKVFFSGKKGIHVTVPYQCFGIEWHPQLDKIYKMMAEELMPFAPNQTLDLKVYERRRLFRIRGSMHASTGSFKVPMELKNLLTKSEEDIQQLSKNPNYGSWIQYASPRIIFEAVRYIKEIEQKVASRYKKSFSNSGEEQTIDFDPPCYQEMIETGPTKGSRNHQACMLVAFWRQRGYTEQEAWDMLIDWNNNSLSERELQTLFRSNFKGHYVYGCNTIKQYASCPATCREDCKFFKRD